MKNGEHMPLYWFKYDEKHVDYQFIETYLDIYFEQINSHQKAYTVGLRPCTHNELYGVDEPIDMKDKKDFKFVCPKDREQL